MRVLAVFLVLSCLSAQDTATYQSSSIDINGRKMEGPLIATSSSQAFSLRTERLQSINGRMVPVEQVLERVIRDGPSGRVVERTVQRFDQDGRPTPPELSLIERENRPDGSTVVRATTSRRDINGNLQIAERSVTETQKTGAGESSETIVERPTIGGSLEPVEKRTARKTGSAESWRQSAATYRRGANGFYEAARVITDLRKDAAATTGQTAEYEIGPAGSLELHSRTARTSTRRADGSETEVVDVFGQSVPGIARASGGDLRLQERDTVERATASDGSVREILRIQRPTVSDPAVLGPPGVASETLCRGKCRE